MIQRFGIVAILFSIMTATAVMIPDEITNNYALVLLAKYQEKKCVGIFSLKTLSSEKTTYCATKSFRYEEELWDRICFDFSVKTQNNTNWYTGDLINQPDNKEAPYVLWVFKAGNALDTYGYNIKLQDELECQQSLLVHCDVLKEIGSLDMMFAQEESVKHTDVVLDHIDMDTAINEELPALQKPSLVKKYTPTYLQRLGVALLMRYIAFKDFFNKSWQQFKYALGIGKVKVKVKNK